MAPPKVSSVFEFEEGGRTYSCCLEGPAKDHPDSWWWFSVSSAADRQRYAPFRAEPGDTPSNIRPKIVAWYEAMLVKRAAPSTPPWRREKPQPAKTEPAEATVAAPAK
ncbi:MAG: hypothetical protein ACT4P7_03385 [Gemmatimonadaceae bacterium]